MACNTCGGTGFIKAGCTRGCTSITVTMHAYWDTYHQHHGQLKCTCTEMIRCHKCNEPKPIEKPKCKCNNGWFSEACSSCNGTRKTNIYDKKCSTCSNNNVVSEKTIYAPTKNGAYSNEVVMHPKLKLIKKKPAPSPFLSPTKGNLLYRFFLSTDFFTKNKIFTNIRFEDDGNCIWDDAIDGEFIEENGIVKVDYENIFSRLRYSLTRCYILVKPDHSAKNVLDFIKRGGEKINFVELPFSLPFAPNERHLLVSHQYAIPYCSTNIPIEINLYECTDHKPSNEWIGNRECEKCNGCGKKFWRCIHCRVD